MKLLKDKNNVGAVDATWLYGNVLDNTGSDDGTRVNKEFITDYAQTWERIFNESGLSANGLEDNEANDWQLYEAFRLITKPYKVYTATINQVGTATPTVNIMGNNEIGTIVWSKISTGEFNGDLVGAFTANKTWFANTQEQDSQILIRRLGNDTIEIRTTNSGGTNTDGILSDTSIEIRVYD